VRSAGPPSRFRAAPTLRHAFRHDVVWTIAVGLITLCLYVLTARPDVGGPEDSPKFQFLGFVLGTAHPPGYPLYVLLSHPFARLPTGTLAFRINVFSGLMGAIACGVVFVLGRQLGATRVSAAGAACALATGATFWRYSILAEVYTLAAAFSAVVMAMLLAWSGRPTRWRLYAACGLFAAALGNHLIIVGLLPAVIAYVVMRDHSVLRPRTMAAAALIGVLGLAPYALVVVRTRQRAPYLEAHARSVPELVHVILARDLAGKQFQFSVGTLLSQRVPVVAWYARDELGLAGVALVLLGVGRAIRECSADAAVLAGAIAGMLVVVVNLKGDVAGFLVPVLVLAWPIAALGLDAIRGIAAPLGRAAPVCAAIVALSLPCVRLAASDARVRPFRNIEDAAAFRTVYAALPAQAAVAYEDYWTQTVMTYLHLSGEIVPDPSPALIPNTAKAARAALAAGRQLFAFEGSAAWLEATGLSFRPAGVGTTALASWLRELPRGTRVAIAASGRPLPYELVPADARGTGFGRPRSFGAMSWIVGRQTFAVDQDDSAAVLSVPASRLWWRPEIGAVRTIEITADATGARIVMGSDRLEVANGAIVMTVRPDGTTQRRLSYTGDAPYTVPSQLRLMAFDHAARCETLRAGTPVNVSPVLETGGWLTGGDRLGTWTIDLQFPASDAPVIRHRVVRGHGSAHVERVWHGRARLVLGRTGWQRPVYRLTAGSAPGPVLATLAPGGASVSLLVCALSPPPILRPGVDSGDILPGGESDDNFGAGWHVAERSGGTRFRWAARTATLLLPMREAAALEVTLRLTAASRDGAILQAAMNDQQAGSCALAPGAWTTCRFKVPAAGVRVGVNQLVLTSTTSVTPGGDARERRELAFSTQGGTLRILR
jgi:hypothetical protein